MGGGATWKVVDQATQGAGVAVTGANVSAVGVGGSTLGGETGWLHRMFGLSATICSPPSSSPRTRTSCPPPPKPHRSLA